MFLLFETRDGDKLQADYSQDPATTEEMDEQQLNNMSLIHPGCGHHNMLQRFCHHLRYLTCRPSREGRHRHLQLWYTHQDRHGKHSNALRGQQQMQ